MTNELRLQRKTELLGKCHHCWKNRVGHEQDPAKNGICARCPGEKKKLEQTEMFDIPKKPREPWLN